MQSWREVHIPALNLDGNDLSVYDSMTQELMSPIVNDEAKLYVCGITPYDATHMGHAATYVAFDTLHRFWRATGTKVRYTQNISNLIRASRHAFRLPRLRFSDGHFPHANHVLGCGHPEV